MTDEEQHCENSVGDIVKFIREARQPVLLVCEKKSAADCLEALLQYPELNKKVGQFIAIDGLIKGASYAENIEAPLDTVEVSRSTKVPFVLAVRFLVDSFFSLIKKQEYVKYKMSPKMRSKYLRNNSLRIKKLSKNIQMISVDRSSKGYGLLPFSTVW